MLSFRSLGCEWVSLNVESAGALGQGVLRLRALPRKSVVLGHFAKKRTP
jgi:hypothetical protein